MNRLAALVIGLLCYFVFFGTFLYQIGFLVNFWVPKSINTGEVVPLVQAIVINLVLLSLFAIQHTIMARLAFKRWWTTIVPAAIERSLYVLLASLILLLMNWQWRPMPELIWHVESSIGRTIIFAVAAVGWLLVLYSTFVINHFDLFGLRQVWLYYQGKEYTQLPFKESMLYQWVRHPIMLGFVIAFWATPDMTQGHLMFAAVTTAYIIVGVKIEERTLVALHGDDYRQYQQRVSMIVPLPRKGKAS